MRKTAALTMLLALAITPAVMALPSSNVHGTYVEARSAQVFIGGCVWNAEAVTVGRKAVLAWRIEDGRIGGIDVAGLSVVAAIAGDANLAIHPDAPRRTVLYVDETANPDQRRVLADLYATRNARMFGEVVDVIAAPIRFVDTADGYSVNAAGEVRLETKALHIDHKKFDQCGAAQWYEPFVPLPDAALGIAIEHSYRGALLNTRWSDPDAQSVFSGHFSF